MLSIYFEDIPTKHGNFSDYGMLNAVKLDPLLRLDRFS